MSYNFAHTPWTHFDVSKPLDPSTCPSPPTYTPSPNELRYTGLADPLRPRQPPYYRAQIARVHSHRPLPRPAPWHSPVHRRAHSRQRLNLHLPIPRRHRMPAQGRGGDRVSLHHLSLRDRGTGIVPLTQRQVESVLMFVLVSVLLGRILPSVTT